MIVRSAYCLVALVLSSLHAQSPRESPRNMYCGGNQIVEFEKGVSAYRITGVVYDDFGSDPIPNATVQVESKATHKLVLDLRANSSGEFEVRGLRPGHYWFGVSAPGFNLHIWDLVVPRWRISKRINPSLTLGT